MSVVSPPRRAAVVQTNAVHDEVMPSVFDVLLAHGIEPTGFLNARIQRRGDVFGPFTPYGDRVRYLELDRRGTLDELVDELRGFDLLVLNTYSYPGQARLADAVGLPTLGVVHNPLLVLHQPPLVEQLRSGRVTPVSLASHATSWAMTAAPDVFGNLATIGAWMWRMHEPAPPRADGRRRVVVPGVVSFATRDLRPLLQQLPDIVDRVGDDRFVLAIAGGGRDRAEFDDLVAQAGLGDVVEAAPVDPVTGSVPSTAYYPLVAGSDLVLPMLPDDEPSYRAFKISAAISSSVGFGVPAVLDRWTAATYRVPAFDYLAGELGTGLATALATPDDDLAELRARLERHRDDEVDRAVAELGVALEVLGRRPPSSPPQRYFSRSHDAFLPGTRANAEREEEHARGPATGDLDRGDLQHFLAFARLGLPCSIAERLEELWALWETGFAGDGWFAAVGAETDGRGTGTDVLEQLGWRGSTATAEPPPPLETLFAQSGAPPVVDLLWLGPGAPTETLLGEHDFAERPVRLVCVVDGAERDEVDALLRDRGYRRKWPELSGPDAWFVLDSELSAWSTDRLPRCLRTLAGLRRRPGARDRARLVDGLRTGHTSPRETLGVASDPPSRNDALDGLAASYRFQAALHRGLAERIGVDAPVLNTRIQRMFSRLCTRLRPSVVLEIGAFEASFSREMRSRLPHAQVVAYEANPYVFDHFKDEVLGAGVDYRHQAVTTTAGTVDIHVPRDFRGTPRDLVNQMSSIKTNLRTEEHRTVPVEAVRLDAEFDASRESFVAWIDVEGATEEVLGGAEEVIDRTRAVYIEVETHRLWAGQWMDTDVARYFMSRGFVLLARDQAKQNQFNLVFVPRAIAERPGVLKLATGVYPRVRPADARP